MFIFSCNATARKALPDVVEGEEMPFMVYIDYADLFGAEHLCKLYLMKAGFKDIAIDKHKRLNKKSVEQLRALDTDIQEAINSGFQVRMFDRH